MNASGADKIPTWPDCSQAREREKLRRIDEPLVRASLSASTELFLDELKDKTRSHATPFSIPKAEHESGGMTSWSPSNASVQGPGNDHDPALLSTRTNNTFLVKHTFVPRAVAAT